MEPAAQVLAAAEARARALRTGDAQRLMQLLHPEFHWTSHRGDGFDRDAYVRANTSGRTRWRSQTLEGAEVTVVADVAVLRCTVVDVVDTGDGDRTSRMPMTQVWVRAGTDWTCLAGHAGPRLE